MDRKNLGDSIRKELFDNLLPFWRERSPDPLDGGFVAEMSHNGTLNTEAPKGLVLNARLLWTFSALYRRFTDERDLALAMRAAEYLDKYFRDSRYGGYIWRVAAGGGCLDSSKKIYGQAFCIYAWSEFHRATGAEFALEQSVALFNLI